MRKPETRLQRFLPPILLLLSSLCSVNSMADSKSMKIDWELGASLAVLDIPLYAGSSQSQGYLLPLPYGVLHSDFLVIDDGLRAKLLGIQDLHISLSADFGVPVSSDESRVRAGMPDLDTVLQVGPLLELSLLGGRHQLRQLRLEFPLRLAFATDFQSAENLGWIAEPRMTYQSRRQHKRGFVWQITTGLRYATADYHDYSCGVGSAFVTADRPVFDANAGYSGLFADMLASWRQRDVIVWTLLRYQNLAASAFDGSPLLEQDTYYFIGAGITWVLVQSL